MVLRGNSFQGFIQLDIVNPNARLFGVLEQNLFDNKPLQHLSLHYRQGREVGFLSFQLGDDCAGSPIQFLLGNDFAVDDGHDAVNKGRTVGACGIIGCLIGCVKPQWTKQATQRQPMTV
jgi:hypothetical protein